MSYLYVRFDKRHNRWMLIESLNRLSSVDENVGEFVSHILHPSGHVENMDGGSPDCAVDANIYIVDLN